MSWNYRVLAHEHKGEITLQVHEVYYHDGEPSSYTEAAAKIIGHTIQELGYSIEWIERGFKEPILYAGDKWPQIYTP